MTIGERIREYRKSLGLTMAQFGERLSITGSAVSLIELGNTNPSDRILKAICAEYNVSREWLETGEGEMEILPLDADTELFAEMQKIESSATLESLKAIARMYVGLTIEERRTLDKMITDAALATKKDPE